MEEPSVLDYLKSIINPWKKDKVKIPELDPAQFEDPVFSVNDDVQPSKEFNADLIPREEKRDASEDIERKKRYTGAPFPWLVIISVVLALAAQLMLELPKIPALTSIVLYVISGIVFTGFLMGDKDLINTGEDQKRIGKSQFRKTNLILSLVFCVISFFSFGSHLFSPQNMFFWLLSIGFGISAFWQFEYELSSLPELMKSKFENLLTSRRISPWMLVLLASMLLVVFFRFYRLDQVPGEMFSDHAEKLIDVGDVLKGNFWTFFPRNTGREAVQMYLTAAVSILFGTGLSFMSLKIGTALAGVLTVPYIYLLGKELGNRWVGLFALLFSGIAYWPNVISRIGLRFPLYPLFAAPVLYYLLRGFKRGRFNDFLLSGLFLGAGLHGYSPIRFLPFVVTFAFVVYWVHPQSKGSRKKSLISLLVLAFIAFLVFLPLLRYWVDDPMMFSYRSMTRLGTVERSYPGSVISIFFTNLWKASIMFFWDNGGIWVHSVTGRPALSVVSASLLFLGSLLVFIRYLKRRSWSDLFLLVSIPLLMMPSILSLAFPEENPSLNRTGGAIIPVFVLIAIAAEFILKKAAKYRMWIGRIFAVIFGLTLLVMSIYQDFDLVFRRFDQQFINSVWNTSEIGKVIRAFVDSSIGQKEHAYVVPYPHWVDTRLVGINAGYPEKDYALWPDQFSETTAVNAPKLFVIKFEDQNTIASLQALYPQSSYWLYPSNIPGKEFWVLFVPPASGNLDAIIPSVP